MIDDASSNPPFCQQEVAVIRFDIKSTSKMKLKKTELNSNT